MQFPQDVSHASFIAQEGCQVDWFAGIILGPTLHFSSMSAAPLMRKEAQVAMPGSWKLPMRLEKWGELGGRAASYDCDLANIMKTLSEKAGNKSPNTSGAEWHKKTWILPNSAQQIQARHVQY